MLLTKLKTLAAILLTLCMSMLTTAMLAWGQSEDKTISEDKPAAKAEKEGAKAQPKDPPKETVAVHAQEFLNDALKEFEAAANEPGGLRHRLLADMAGLQARLGDRDAAKKLFEQVSAMVAAMDESQQSREWRFVTGAAARAGEVDEAIGTVRRIPAANQAWDNAIQQVATALARQRFEKEALRVAAMVEDQEMKSRLGVTLLEELALAYGAAGNIPEALRVVERMKGPSSQVTALLGRFQLQMNYDYPNNSAAQGIAMLQAKAGDQALAKKTLQRATDLIASMPEDTPAWSRALALTKLACAQARLGEFANARKTREKIQDETGKAIALATLIRQLTRAGRAKEAMAEIDPLPVGTTKVHALTFLGAGQAEAGDQKAARASFQQAHLLIEQLSEEEDRMSQGSILATVRAEAGDYEGAIQTAKTYNPENTLVYANIAFAHAKAGDFTGALEIAEKLKNRPRQGPDWWKLRILQATAERQAQSGDSKAALEWIGRLDSHLSRAHALMGLAEGTLTATTPSGKK